MIKLSLLLTIGIVALLIWTFLGTKSLKSKVKTTFIFLFLLALLISTLFLFGGKKIDPFSYEGIKEIGTTYFSFITITTKNIFSLTSNAIKMDWIPKENENNSSNNNNKK